MNKEPIQLTQMTTKQEIILDIIRKTAKKGLFDQPDIIDAYAKIKNVTKSSPLRTGVGVVLDNLQKRGYIKHERKKESPYGIIQINVWRVLK